jgi:parvulin-like peptidyl-prolyl isomerase
MKLIKNTFFAAALIATSINAAEVLATVNENPIKKSDIDFILKKSGITFDKLTPQQQEKMINRLIERELLYNVAKKSGVEKDEDYKKALEDFKKNLMVQVWMDKIYKRTLISDSEANKYYQDHKNEFKIPKKVHARHILVKTEDEAKKIIEQLKSLKGEALKKKFIELAKEKSTGPSGKNGGDLGFFAKGQMVKPFEEAAFSLKKGEITTKPVKTQFGYHIIYLEDVKPESIAKFEDVKNAIIAKMRQEQFSKTIKETIENQKKSSKIKINFKVKDKNSSK